MDFTQVSYELKHQGNTKFGAFIVESEHELTDSELKKILNATRIKGVTIDFHKIVKTDQVSSEKGIPLIHSIENSQEIEALSKVIQKQAEELMKNS